MLNLIVELVGYNRKFYLMKYLLFLGCNGNLGRALCDFYTKSGGFFVIGIDLQDQYQGNEQLNKYITLNFLTEGFSSKILKIINLRGCNISIVNLIAKDYPVIEGDVQKNMTNSPFELPLDDVCNSYKITLGSSYKLIQEIAKLDLIDNLHIILVGSIYSKKLPIHEIYSTENTLFKPLAYSLSKSAQNMLMQEAVRLFSSDKIRINMISFGGVFSNQSEKFVKKYSEKVPINRMVNLLEVIDAFSWVIEKSPQSFNGSDLLIDGGWSCAN